MTNRLQAGTAGLVAGLCAAVAVGVAGAGVAAVARRRHTRLVLDRLGGERAPRLWSVIETARRWRTAEAARQADRELPAVLEHVARAVRSGASLPGACEQATPAGARLLEREWRALVARSRDVGIAEAAAAWRAGRPDSSAVLLASGALRLVAAVGGPQARAIDGVATTLRSRLLLDAEVRALSSQARASAAVIGAAPLAFAVIAVSVEPSYAAMLVRPAGLLSIGAGLALEAAGFAWMARIARIGGG